MGLITQTSILFAKLVFITILVYSVGPNSPKKLSCISEYYSASVKRSCALAERFFVLNSRKKHVRLVKMENLVMDLQAVEIVLAQTEFSSR